MPGQLDHNPACILRELMIGLDLGTDPDLDPQQDWPIFAPNEADLPPCSIAVTPTSGTDRGKTMDGERQGYHGCQIMIRHRQEDVGYAKAEEVAAVLNRVWNRNVTLNHPETEAPSAYVVRSIRAPQVLPLGRAVPVNLRYLFTINVLVSMRKLS